MKARIASWMLRIIAAVILLQTLFFKFTADAMSVEIFTRLGMEPWGRIGTGVAELMAALLLLIPRTVPLGAILGMGLMAGALMSHVTQLGFEGDMLSLAGLAVLVLLCCSGALLLHLCQRKRTSYRART